jgi:hypothetical protein
VVIAVKIFMPMIATGVCGSIFFAKPVSGLIGHATLGV